MRIVSDYINLNILIFYYRVLMRKVNNKNDKIKLYEFYILKIYVFFIRAICIKVYIKY